MRFVDPEDWEKIERDGALSILTSKTPKVEHTMTLAETVLVGALIIVIRQKRR
ncbi:MAG: hypothetical protein ACREX4_09535 [Gammaproteobacteria bacterium]